MWTCLSIRWRCFASYLSSLSGYRCVIMSICSRTISDRQPVDHWPPQQRSFINSSSTAFRMRQKMPISHQNPGLTLKATKTITNLGLRSSQPHFRFSLSLVLHCRMLLLATIILVIFSEQFGRSNKWCLCCFTDHTDADTIAKERHKNKSLDQNLYRSHCWETTKRCTEPA